MGKYAWSEAQDKRRVERRPQPLNKKPRKEIKRVSEKREAINKDTYTPSAAKFRQANPLCVIKSPVCSGFTEGVHHTEGKATIELLNDQSKWLPACNRCNLYIEVNTEWAKEKGFKKANYTSKLTGVRFGKQFAESTG